MNHDQWEHHVVGGISMRHGVTLKVVHLRHPDYGSEMVQLLLAYTGRGDVPREHYLNIDASAVPALIELLEKLE